MKLEKVGTPGNRLKKDKRNILGNMLKTDDDLSKKAVLFFIKLDWFKHHTPFP